MRAVSFTLFVVKIFVFQIFSEICGQELINLNLGMKDDVSGFPAGNIPCELFKPKNNNCEDSNCDFIKWKKISEAVTSPDTGKAIFPLEANAENWSPGVYKFSCDIRKYFKTSFYDEIVGVFTKESEANDPILLNGVLCPYGYSVYKGSAAHAP